MPQFTPSQKQLTDFNNGNKFVNHVDSPSADDFNNVIESQLYTQGLAKNTPDTSEANNVGTPSVIIVIAPDGTAKLKFSNLKGAGISNIIPNGTDQSGNNIYVIQLTDGSSYNFTSPKGSQGIQGEQGIGIANIIPNGQDSTGSNIYTVLLTNGTSYNFTAPKGAQGIQGNTGVGISTITPNGTDINGGNIYRITLTDGSYYDFTAPKGNQGENGNDPNAVHYTEQELTSSQQSQARTNIGAAAASKLKDYLPLTGGTLTGNLTGKYITGTWLQATAANHQTSAASKIAVFDVSGWLYYRTSAELLSDIGAAAQKNEHNGFEAGNEASAQAGGAIGSGAIADAGGAVGSNAKSTTGGAVGYSAEATDGFAGGNGAKATASGAVQLGNGTNNNANTLQFQDWQIIDASGHLTAARMTGVSYTWSAVQNFAAGFTALNGGFSFSDPVNVGMELGRRDGTPGTPYIDFHTDGSSSTDYNSRIFATGNGLQITAEDGVSINGNNINAISMAPANYSSRIEVSVTSSPMTYTAPANGYFVVYAHNNGSIGYVNLQNRGTGINIYGSVPGSMAYYNIYVPARAGNYIWCSFTAVIDRMFFIPAYEI